MENKKELIQEIMGVLVEEHMKSELKETLKLAADSMKNFTFNRLLSEDEEYNNRLKEYREACEKYRTVEFTKEQREIVDLVMARGDECNFDKVTDAYLAGLLDSYRILRNFDLTKE